MFSETRTTAADFTPGGATAVTPSGKTIYLSDIGNFHLQLMPLVPVSWRVFDSSGSQVGTTYSIPGRLTNPIDNSYFSKAYGAALVESIIDGKLYQAAINRDNFDLSILDSLPSRDSRDNDASGKSTAANIVTDLENASAIDKFIYSIFGQTGKEIGSLIKYGALAFGAWKIFTYLNSKR